MAQSITISAEPRSATGKSAARALRRAGKVPAVIYGHGRATEPLAVSATDLEKALHGISAESTVIELDVNGTTSQVLIREIQRHPTKMDIRHVDFYEIHAGETITVGIPVRLVGSPAGVRNQGGVLEQFLRELEIEVLPQDIPDQIEVEVTALEIGDSLHVSDLTFAVGKILDDPERTICTVVPPRIEEEVVVAPAPEEELAEPELIRKPKAEEEEEEAETGESEEREE